MERLSIACVSCGRVWTAPASLSVYERQALESRPCPGCGVATLSCREPSRPPARPRRAARALAAR